MLIIDTGAIVGRWEVGHYVPQHNTGTGEDWEWIALADFNTFPAAAGFLHFLNGGALLDLEVILKAMGAE